MCVLKNVFLLVFSKNKVQIRRRQLHDLAKHVSFFKCLARVGVSSDLHGLKVAGVCGCVTHSERLVVDGVQRLLLHRRLLLTVTGQVWQEVGFHISGREGEKRQTHTHTRAHTQCYSHWWVTLPLQAATRRHSRVGAALARRGDVLAAVHSDVKLLPLGVVEQRELNAAPHLHRAKVPRAE